MRKTGTLATALLVAVMSVAACSSKSSTASPTDGPDSAAPDDAGGVLGDATADTAPVADTSTVDADKAAACASTFGSELAEGFGRLDGTVLAVVPPADNACALPNSDHLILQVTMHGAAYRMVVNVQSDQTGDLRVQMKEVDAPLTGGDWSEGWHVPAALDYPSALMVHAKDFTPYELAPLVQRITDFIGVGDKISVFATNNSATYKDSAHLVHYNGANQDGAIVVGAATGSPKYLLFHFSEQLF